MQLKLIAIVFLFFIGRINAQQPLYSHFKNLKVEDGLPQSFVSGLQQDKDGFLWVATRDGLARYDGRSFTVFRHLDKDSNSIQSNVIMGLYMDPQGLLWIMYTNSEFECFDPATLKVIRNPETQTIRKILIQYESSRFIRDKTGVYWVITNRKGVIRYDPSTRETTVFSTKNKTLYYDGHYDLVENQQGDICLYGDFGIEILNEQGCRFFPFNDDLNFKSAKAVTYRMAVLTDDIIALNEINRLLLFDPLKKTFRSVPLPVKDCNIRHLIPGPDKHLYIEANGVVYRMDKNFQIARLWQYPGNHNDYAISLLMDQSGVLWFGSNASGIYKVDTRTLPFHSGPYTVNFTHDILAGEMNIVSAFPASIKSASWSYGLRYCNTPGKTFWISQQESEEYRGGNTIYTLSNRSLAAVPFPEGKYPPIRGLSLAPTGIMYAMDILGNTWSWEHNTSMPRYTSSAISFPPTCTVVDLETDEKYQWVSTNKIGLYKIANSQIVEHFSTADKKWNWPSDMLTDLCNDPLDKNILWIGTLGYGLIRLDKTTGNIRTFTVEDGLPNNTVYGIVPDAKNNLWISTNKGICRFGNNGKSIYNFDIKDGLPGNEFNRFHHLKLPDGRIAFGGIDGYSIFDPAAFAPDTFHTSVGLTKIVVNNNPIDFTDGMKGLPSPINQLEKLVLPYNKNFLQFEFAGMQFNQPEKISYRYMLKGYDKEWINTGNRNIAVYTRLPPGVYTLMINASNTSGDWSPDIKEIAIRIRPPLWATWWAYCLYAGVALLLIRLYWKHRATRMKMQHAIELEQSKANHLKEVDEIKDRFFSNITHELRTPLTLILTPLEKLQKSNDFSSADNLVLSNAYKNAEQLLRLINQLLDISKIESGQMKLNPTVGELSEFVSNCVQQFTLQAKHKNIQLDFSSSGISGLYLFDEEKWEKIIFNLLSNAIKFTGETGEVKVSIDSLSNDELSDTMVQLTVEDTGYGIPEKDIPKLFDRFYMADDSKTRKQGGTGIGLALVKELTTLMGGAINVSSTVGKGTIFTVELPVAKAIRDSSQVKKHNLEHDIPVNNTISSFEDNIEKPLVLVVEDNPELLSFLVQSLAVKWRVIQANNGTTGWEMIQEELPDLVISDVMMPGMDGYELCSRVKEDTRTGHIGFILLTARAAHESRLSGLKKGADAYLTKPFHLDELEQQLHNLIDQQQRLRKHLQKELLPETPLRKLPHVNDLFLQELYKQMDEKLDDPRMSVETLAQSVAMSQRTLNRKLKAILNITPVEFIRQYRLQKAAVLLSSGQGISDIAYEVGFETASYFSKCFKEHFGKTPTEFAAQKTA